jgi:hypothetical protein
MAKLVITSPGFKNQVIYLKLGKNRFGRSPECDFTIEHPTISATHCELTLGADGVTVRDCNSTNGTYVAERPITQAALWAGQVLRIGDVEVLVESTDPTIAIPKIEFPVPAPPIVKPDGTMMCPRHKEAKVTHRCTQCKAVLCDECVHRLRRRGGKILKLCPLCSHKCEPLEKPAKRKKQTVLGFLAKTVKMAFLREPKSNGE